MRKTILTLTLFVLYATVSAQTLQWNRTIKSIGNEIAYDLATDNSGFVYIAGMIEYDADFGNGITLESVGSHDIFIAKYDTSGNLIWARRAGGKGGDKVQSIVLDGQGSLYVVGEFEDTCRWGAIVKVTPAIGVNNMFVARYDTSGNVQWVRNIETSGHLHTRGYGVACDSQSNVYVSGACEGPAYYDSTYLFTTAGDYDCMLLKFDKFGNLGWARRMGGTDSDKSRSITYDGTANLYVTGYFSGTADFLGTTLVGRGHTDAFLAKFDTAGTILWAKQAGDTGFDRGWDVDINVNGNVLISGDESRGYFDSNLASCNGRTDGFVAAYDISGNNLWVVAGGGPEDDECKAVSHDNAGNIYVIGDFGGSAVFPPYSFSGGHFAEVYIASYTADGASLRWVRSGSGPLNDRGNGLGLDNAGNIYATGDFDSTLYIGGITIAGDSLLDIYLTRFSAYNICSSIANITGTINCAGTCTGSSMVSATGEPPFTYSWNTTPVQHGQTAVGLCAGNYIVTVTDSFGCSSTATITLVDPPPLVVTSTMTGITCNGVCDGAAIAMASGQAPFTYSWNSIPMQTNATATSLCAGTYTVTVTDVAGCIETNAVTLIEPATVTVMGNATNTTCIGCGDGAIDITAAGGTGAYQYAWSNGSTTEDIQNIPAGAYSVCIADANMCTVCDTFLILDPTSDIAAADALHFSVFPNPAVEFCMINVDASFSGGTGIKLYDLIGSLIYSNVFFGNEFLLPFEVSENGLYYLCIENIKSGTMNRIPVIINSR